jgi:rhodanese-related sulfurtransferase
MNSHPSSFSTSPSVSPITLKQWLHDGAEISLLDVREHGQYGESHLFYAVPLPYSRLEVDVGRLVPRLTTRIVAYDDGANDTIAGRAATRLAGLGYTNVSVLAGGIAAWREAGLTCFAGVNLPSKTFGELAEEVYHTPRISAGDLAGKLAAKENVVVLDGRPYAEFQKMSIPQAVCCPNGELPLRVRELARDPETTIVINCAGRTRSIIGAQTLIDLGIPNPVYALENGTQGWYLADLPLDHGATRRFPDVVEPDSLPALRTRTAAFAERFHVSIIDGPEAQAWLDDTQKSTFLCDVRNPDEFAAGSLPGAQSTPGGQLLQSTDQYVGVRGARLIVFDAEGVRAVSTANWLQRMGWNVHVLKEGLGAKIRTPATPAKNVDTQALVTIESSALGAAVSSGAVLVDVRASAAYRKSHIRGAAWSIRPRLAQLGIAADANVILLADDRGIARLAEVELNDAGVRNVVVNTDCAAVWKAAGLALDSTPDDPPDSECIDFLFFVHDRHDGNKAAARQYLAWETGLLAQIDDQERTAFKFSV